MERVKRLARGLRNHLIDSTAVFIESTPVYALVETLTGMSNDTSFNARAFGALTFFGGVGKIWTKGRELSSKLFGIDKYSSDKSISRHDAFYSMGFNVLYCPVMYVVAGSTDIRELTFATLGAAALGFVNGAPQGYAVDVAEDLAGIRNCERTTYSSFIKNQTSKVKKGILAGALAASVGLTGLLYAATPDEGIWKNAAEPPRIERIISPDKK